MEYSGNPQAVIISGGTVQADIQGGTIQIGSITVAVDLAVIQANNQGTIQTNAVLSASGASTLQAGTLQDLVVDVIYGTVVSGSVQTYVSGVEPQSALKTSTIVSGSWFAGTLQTGQRIVAIGPLGQQIAVGWTVPSGSTVMGVYITAEQSFGP